jgi:Tol biopolymer transport system component
LASVLSSLAHAQTTQRASVSSTGTQGNGQVYFGVGISADGRFVAFGSTATNIISGGASGTGDIYLRDVQTNTTELISVSTAGVHSNNGSYSPTISADGRYVVFGSQGSNLDPIDLNGAEDVFLRDRVAGTTSLISLSSAGGIGDGYSDYPVITPDGRFVAFVTSSTDLVPGDTNSVPDVMVRDLVAGTTERVSVDSVGAQGNNLCFDQPPAISADGRYVAFGSLASNLVAGDTNGACDVFVHDRLTGLTERASVDSAGVQGNAQSGHFGVSLSADGRYVAFASDATNLVAGDTNAYSDAFVHDRLTGATERVSVSSAGGQGNYYSGTSVNLSADGRFVAFDSSSFNLDPNDPTFFSDIYLRDRLAGTTELVSIDSNGVHGDSYSTYNALSADGRVVAFSSLSSNLVPGDTNGVFDTFVRERGAAGGVGFCFGDGSGTSCPCGNNSPFTARAGCLNSLGSGGRLVATGTPSISADTLVLHGSGMPSSSVLYYQGTTQVNGGAGVVFGDGLRCAGGSIIRLEPKTNVAGASRWPDVGDPAISVRCGNVAGNSRTYQAWYRNAAAFCSPAAFNLTNGWSLTWTP